MEVRKKVHVLQSYWMAAVLVTVSLLIAAACGGSTTSEQDTVAKPTAVKGSESSVATSVPTAIPAIAGQTFTFPAVPAWVSKGKYQPMVLQGATKFNPGQWDVQSCGGLPSCLQPSSMQFNGLVYHDPNDPIEIICDLCESWEVSADGATYTFKIREANWHDGKPVTANDIQYSFDRITEPDAIRARTDALKDFYQYQTAKVLDEHTVEIPLKFASPLFLVNLSSEYMKMYPKHATENLTPDEAHQAGTLLGSGAWKLKNFEPQVAIEYERNQDYFKESRPFFDGLKFTVIKDYNRLLVALQVGQVFTTGGPNIGTYGNENSIVLQNETNGRVRAAFIKDAVSTWMVLHANKPPFDDERMRRAIFLAIDREELVDIVRCRGELGCFGSQGTFFPRKGGFNVEPLEELAQVPGWRQPKDLDIAEAKKLMAEAGYADGVDGLTWNLSTSPSGIQQAEVVTEQLRNSIGMDIKLEPADRATTVARIREGSANVSADGSGVIISDPSDYLNQHFTIGTHKNPDAWSDPRLDKIIDAQARELDPAKRLKMFREATEILREGHSQFVPMTWGYSGGLLDYRLQGYIVPESEQQVKHWEAIWWDPDAVCPSTKGCQ